jgi:GTP-binding protein
MGPLGKPVEDVATIVGELKGFSEELAGRERWLVLNKTDMLPEDEREQRCRDVVQALNWQGPVFEISALGRQGTDKLVQAVMEFVEQHNAREAAGDEV